MDKLTLALESDSDDRSPIKYVKFSLLTGDIIQTGEYPAYAKKELNEDGIGFLWGMTANPLLQRVVNGNLVDVVPVVTREQIAAQIADARWRHETGGTVWQGKPVNTEREAIVLLNMAVDYGVASGTFPAAWKFNDGAFYVLSAADYESLRNAVRAHIQAAFAWEAAELRRLADVADADLIHFTMRGFKHAI